MRLVAVTHITLDGVMQAPGRFDEDTRNHFTHGGWATAGNDPALFAAIGERMGTLNSALLLGRRSYEDIFTTWNARGGPFTDGLNNTPKYVASSILSTALPWPNSTLLHGDMTSPRPSPNSSKDQAATSSLWAAANLSARSCPTHSLTSSCS